jgi:hypothetical protein
VQKSPPLENIAAQHQFARPVDQRTEIKHPRWEHILSSSNKVNRGLAPRFGHTHQLIAFFLFQTEDRVKS